MKKMFFTYSFIILHLTLICEMNAQSFNFKKYLFDPPSTLSINIQSLNKTSGYVEINGVDLGVLSGPFDWDWGDGSTIEQEWFPNSHTYINKNINYVVKVTANYSGGGTDEAEVLVRFVPPPITPITLSAIIAVHIPDENVTLGTRSFPGYTPPSQLTFFDDDFFTDIPRTTLEYILSVAATIQRDFVNDNTYLFDNKFEEFMLRDNTFGGAYSLWFTDPVAFGVGDVFMRGTIGYSSLFHEMGHNFTLNTPNTFYFGGRIDGNANAIYSESMAQIFQHATGYEIVNNYLDYGLSEDIMFEIKKSVIESIKLVRSSYEQYISSGNPYTSWNDPLTPEDGTFLTFMTIAYKFFEHAENSDEGYLLPLKRMMTLLQGFCQDWMDEYDPGNNTYSGNVFRATLMVRALSDAFQTDLRDEFLDLNFPISDEIYSALPVALESFKCSLSDPNSVLLKWRTVTEVNNYGFNIERKIQSEEWKTIGFVGGNGNSNSIKEYSFIDNLDHNLNLTHLKYRLKQIDNDGKYEYSKVVEVTLIDQPKTFELLQNYPNPFNPNTTIKFNILNTEKVKLVVYDILGRKVRVLIDNIIPPGNHSVNWNGKDETGKTVTSGIYFYDLKTEKGISITRKMILVK